MGRIRDPASNRGGVDLAGCRETQEGNHPQSMSGRLQNSFSHCLSFSRTGMFRFPNAMAGVQVRWVQQG